LMLLTTSRRPTARMRAFCRDLENSLPDVTRVNRGKMSLDGVAEKAIELEADRVIVVDRWYGGLGKINLFKLTSTGLKAVPPLMLIDKLHLRRELNEGRRGAQSSVITLQPEDSVDLKRIAGHLSKYFGLPVLPLYKASQNHRASMHFSFDSSMHVQITFMLLAQMIEIGPRVVISKLIWEVPS